MRISKILILILGVGIFATYSCREIFDKQFISEGIIEYRVSYIETDEPNYLSHLMPENMICYFKNNKVALDLSGGMGLFRTTFVFDNDHKTFLQMVKMIQKKYASKLDSTQSRRFTYEYPDMVINHKEELKEIAGYKCKKAEVLFKDKDYEGFDIYYTNDINIQSPNWSSQYAEIDGVLMEYRMKKYNMEMVIKAVKVSNESIDESIFELPKDYKLITQEEMDDLFLTFQ